MAGNVCSVLVLLAVVVSGNHFAFRVLRINSVVFFPSRVFEPFSCNSCVLCTLHIIYTAVPYNDAVYEYSPSTARAFPLLRWVACFGERKRDVGRNITHVTVILMISVE